MKKVFVIGFMFIQPLYIFSMLTTCKLHNIYNNGSLKRRSSASHKKVTQEIIRKKIVDLEDCEKKRTRLQEVAQDPNHWQRKHEDFPSLIYTLNNFNVSMQRALELRSEAVHYRYSLCEEDKVYQTKDTYCPEKCLNALSTLGEAIHNDKSKFHTYLDRGCVPEFLDDKVKDCYQKHLRDATYHFGGIMFPDRFLYIAYQSALFDAGHSLEDIVHGRAMQEDHRCLYSGNRVPYGWNAIICYDWERRKPVEKFCETVDAFYKKKDQDKNQEE